MNFRKIDFTTPTVEEKYVWAMAHYNDRYYEFECPCGQELVGRTKSDLVENFKTHFMACPSK